MSPFRRSAAVAQGIVNPLVGGSNPPAGAVEAAENLGNFDHRFDVPRALGGAQRLIGNAQEAVRAARER